MELAKQEHPIISNERQQVKLSDLRDEFIDYIGEKGRSAQTIKEYKNAVQHLINILGDVYIDSIDIGDFQKWRKKRPTASKHTDRIKNITINKEHRHLKAVFNFAIKKKKYIKDSPFVDEDRIETGKKTKPVMPQKDIKKFFSVIDDQRDKAFFKMLYYYGCRPSEAWKLLWGDVFIDEEIPYLIFRDRKGNDELELPILDDLKTDLDQLERDDERVFSQIRYGQSWKPNEIMKEYLEQAGLPDKYSPKWFRHTFASVLSEDSMGVKAVLGHSTVKVTEGYTHSDLERKLGVISRLSLIKSL